MRSWLFGIVRRTLVDHYRRPLPPIPLKPEIAEHLIDNQLGPEEAVVSGERARQGQALLAALKPEQQEVLCLRFLAELTYAEIAQVVGLVRNYLATARSEAEVVAYREERKRHRLSSLIKQGDEMADRRASRATVRALAAVVARPSEEAATDEAS